MSKKHIILGLGLLAAFYGEAMARGGAKERQKARNNEARAKVKTELDAVRCNLEKLAAFTAFVHNAATIDPRVLERKHLEKIDKLLQMYPYEELYANFFCRVQADCRAYKRCLAQANLLDTELTYALDDLESYAAQMQYYSVMYYRPMVWAYTRFYNPHN